MPILYQHQGDEAITWATIAFDEGPDWWVGVQKCAATVALATALAITGTQTAAAKFQYSQQQDDPAGNLKATPEELYWQLGPRSVPASLTWPNQWTFDEQIPAGNLHGTPEEVYWQLGPAPVPASLLYPQQQLFDEQIPAGFLVGQPDEDFCQVYIPPVSSSPSLLYWFDGAEDLPQQVISQPIQDEDFWQNPVPPIPATFYQNFPYLPDPEEIPAAQLYGQPDEDFWVNAVQPVQANLTWPQPFSFDQSEIVPQPVTFQPDEDFWQVPIQPVLCQVYPQQWVFDEQIPAGTLQGQYDEDFWINPVAPVSMTFLYPSPSFDSVEITTLPPQSFTFVIWTAEDDS